MKSPVLRQAHRSHRLASCIRITLVSTAIVTIAQSGRAQLLPDAPQPRLTVTASKVLSPGPVSTVSNTVPASGLTLRERFALQTRISFCPTALLMPAVETGITMAKPPDGYPHDWSDGPGAFGRNYASELGRHTTSGYTHFAAAALLHEDPRYYPSSQSGVLPRVLHAVAFTAFDHSDSGHRILAASNFIGATAGGFIGMTWEPNGFNDVTHAYQRSSLELLAFVARNLAAEFAPERRRMLFKLHLAHEPQP